MRGAIRLAAALALCAGLLAGCGGGASGPQVRIFDGSSVPSGGTGQASTTGGSSRVATAQGGGVHSVRRGETLYAISRAYGVPLRTLIVENGLSPPYELLVGQRLRIPAAQTHTVRRGETVYGISRQYGVAMNELVRTNRIQPPYTIRVGQTLSIPASTRSRRTVITRSDAPAPPPQSPGSAEPAARQADRDQTAALPAEPPRPEPAPAPPRPAQADAPPPEIPDEPEYGPGGAVYPVAKPPPPPRLVGPIPQPPALEGGGFLWPVQGRIVSNYGPKGRGLHNDGINIAAPRGTAVRAAQAGVVAYAGEGLQGFGRIVLIKHRDGYVTAYAHADDLLVSRGQIIRRGQAIARIGSTGDVDTPQLHFQIRQGREAIDPRRLLLTS
jgi:murein DD-endopeptidase MepM/ murein hydrolase activator NlpD